MGGEQVLAKRSTKRATTGARRVLGAVGLAATLGGVTLLANGPVASAQPPATGNISITQSAIVPLTGCTTPDQALTYSTFSDSSTFRLRVRAASPLCAPITATAVIYAMPKDGSVWPQTLTETKAFTISGAGVTDIVFTKNCTPAQFDVITGGTPQVISPLGEKHGPLLFPDTSTAYQDPGVLCEPSGSTTVPSSTSIPAATTTSPNNVVTSTTVGVGDTTVSNSTTTTVLVQGTSVNNTTTAPPRVLGTSQTSSGSGTSPSTLAVTGVSSQGTALAGLGLLVMGVGMLVIARRRGVPVVRMITSTVSVNPNSPFGLD